MKIEGPTGPSQIRYTGKVTRAKTSSGSFVDKLDATSESASTSATSATSGVFGIEQLLGLQEVEDATTGKGKARQYGTDILDKLDELRLQILDGRISVERLQQLSRSVTARKAMTSDPQVMEILDEIDLRAQVEIAKYMRDREPV